MIFSKRKGAWEFSIEKIGQLIFFLIIAAGFVFLIGITWRLLQPGIDWTANLKLCWDQFPNWDCLKLIKIW